MPAYLNGSLAGDYGYDPLGLGKDTETVEKYRAYELLHARWAMLAAAGIIIPEGLQARNPADLGTSLWSLAGFGHVKLHEAAYGHAHGRRHCRPLGPAGAQSTGSFVH